MNESLIKYLAGLLDADGSLSFGFKQDTNREDRHFIGLTLSLASSDAVDQKAFVEGLPVETGMGSVSRYGAKSQFKTWAVSRRADLEMILPRLIKHMVIKAGHWQWLLDTWRELRTQNKTVSSEERDQLKLASKESRRTRNAPLKAKNYPTWAWLAGYLDGDGWYTYRPYSQNGYQQWKISTGAVAHGSDVAVLEFLQRSYGGTVRPHGQSEGVMIWTRSLGYQNRSFALEFLRHLAKHSRLKRHKIDAIIHHHRQRLSVPGTDKTFCSVDECGSPTHGNGLCSKHYQHERKSVQATV